MLCFTNFKKVKNDKKNNGINTERRVRTLTGKPVTFPN